MPGKRGSQSAASSLLTPFCQTPCAVARDPSLLTMEPRICATRFRRSSFPRASRLPCPHRIRPLTRGTVSRRTMPEPSPPPYRPRLSPAIRALLRRFRRCLFFRLAIRRPRRASACRLLRRLAVHSRPTSPPPPRRPRHQSRHSAAQGASPPAHPPPRRRGLPPSTLDLRPKACARRCPRSPPPLPRSPRRSPRAPAHPRVGSRQGGCGTFFF